MLQSIRTTRKCAGALTESAFQTCPAALTDWLIPDLLAQFSSTQWAQFMRIRYEITVEDQLAFNLHFQKNSPTLRRGRIAAMFAVSVFLISSFGAIAELLRRPEFVWVGVSAAVLFVVMFPRYWRRNTKRLNSRLFRERPNRALFGPRVSEIREPGLFTSSDFVETMVFWKAIERVDTVPGHTFVYLATVTAVVIPEHNVLEGDYHSFVDELRRRWQQVRGETSRDDLDHR